MSKLTAAFNQSRRNLSTRTIKPSGNLILKVKEFTDATVKGEIMTGPVAGTDIEIKVPNNGPRTSGIKEFTKKTHKSFVNVEAGGTLRVEKVREGKDGIYDARWMRTFNGQPEEKHDVIYDGTTQLRTIKSSDPDTPDTMLLQVLFEGDASEATSIDQLRDEIGRAFEEKDGVHIFFKEEGEVGSIYYKRGGEMIDDVWVLNDAMEEANNVIASFGDNRPIFEKALEEHPFSVVPSKQVRVGSYTAEMIAEAFEEAREKGEDARISTIDPKKFSVIPTGVRVQNALSYQNQDAPLPGDAAERLKERFLANATDEVKETFHKGGWRAVSNDDMRRFFEAEGVSIKAHEDTGWSRQSLLLWNGLAIKAFGQDAAVPYPNLSVCKDAIQEFRNEVREAIRAVVDAPVKSVAAEAAKAEAAAKADVQTKEAEAVSTEADIDDLDALLDGVQDADMGA